MLVWVNTSDRGWVQHGKARSSAERAAAVASLLNRRLGWETASGPMPPPARPAPVGAPTAADAAVSPAPLRGMGPPRSNGDEERKVTAVDALETEPYLEELASFALEAQLRDFIAANIARIPIRGSRLRLYSDSAGHRGVEYPSGVGPIDILAVDDSGNFFVFRTETRSRTRPSSGAVGKVHGLGTEEPRFRVRRSWPRRRPVDRSEAPLCRWCHAECHASRIRDRFQSA